MQPTRRITGYRPARTQTTSLLLLDGSRWYSNIYLGHGLLPSRFVGDFVQLVLSCTDSCLSPVRLTSMPDYCVFPARGTIPSVVSLNRQTRRAWAWPPWWRVALDTSESDCMLRFKHFWRHTALLGFKNATCANTCDRFKATFAASEKKRRSCVRRNLGQSVTCKPLKHVQTTPAKVRLAFQEVEWQAFPVR